MKKIIYPIVFILLLNLVNGGVSHPSPLKLAPGEGGEFHFAVDAAVSPVSLECKIEFQQKSPLKITFNKMEVTLNPGQREFIQGEVKVPKNIEYGKYEETFCVSCDKVQDVAGTTTKPRYCDIPITVTVQESPTQLNKESPSNNLWLILLITINFLLLVIIIFLLVKRRNKF